ncbi:hypothetical protein ACFPRL_21755 [Pseudoclavibacter helvolus]
MGVPTIDGMTTKSARDGIVNTMLATTIAIARPRGRPTRSIPTGSAMTSPRTVGTTASTVCWMMMGQTVSQLAMSQFMTDRRSLRRRGRTRSRRARCLPRRRPRRRPPRGWPGRRAPRPATGAGCRRG